MTATNVNITAARSTERNTDSVKTANTASNDDGHSASVLLKLLEDMATSEEGAKDAEILREWIQEVTADNTPGSLDMKDDEDYTLLHTAARRGLAEAAKRLIDAGANLNARDTGGSTPLNEACWGEHIDIVKLLLDKGADSTIFDRDGWSPLYIAATYRCTGITKLLLEKREWNLDFKEKLAGRTSLHAAAYGGDAVIVGWLRDRGAKLDLRDDDGWTPLMTAVVHREEGALRKLLDRRNGEDVRLETEDSEGRTPLLRAAEDSFWDGVRVLVKAGAKCDKSSISETTETDSASVMTRKEKTALHLAVWENNFEMTKFLLENDADVNARNYEGQQALHLASLQGNDVILKYLLENKSCNHLNSGDDDGMTPLHLASSADTQDDLKQNTSDTETNRHPGVESTKSESESESGSSPERHDEVVSILLSVNANTEALANNGKTALELAFDHGHYQRREKILDVFAKAEQRVPDILSWAAGQTSRHDIAIFLIKRQLQSPDDSATEERKMWTAIEWAAYARDPRALWLLIANSPRNEKTKQALHSAKEMIDKSKIKAVKPVTKPEKPRQEQLEDAKKHEKTDVKQEMQDIINNPPIGLICTDSPTYGLPEDEFPSLREVYKAAIVQFYKERGQFGKIMKSHAVRETIYSQGPKRLMEEVAKNLRKYANPIWGGSKKSIVRGDPMFMGSEPNFTWIHLPATIMPWMEHLVQRIMRDENQDASSFNQAKSFFKDSWIEVPDKVSRSRMMRPRFVSRNAAENEPRKPNTRLKSTRRSENEVGGDGEGKKDAKEEDRTGANEAIEKNQNETQDEDTMPAASLAASAIYVPYLSYSFQCCDGADDDNNNKMDEPSVTRIKTEVKQSHIKEPTTGHHVAAEGGANGLEAKGHLEHVEKLRERRQTYEDLLEGYSNKVIHGSSTLDESYYHFGDDPHSTKDKEKRNRSQVVTRSWKSARDQTDQEQENQDGEDQDEAQEKRDQEEEDQEKEDQEKEEQNPGPYWLLIRVNQLWIWTINNRWLISASSHPIDDGENELLTGILDRLEKQGEAGGSDLQPGSTTEMARLIVDYCVDFYERKPKAHEDERPEDCKLKDFPSIRQVFSKSINSIARDETNLSKQFINVTRTLRNRLYANTKENREAVKNMDMELAKAIFKAKELSISVKDILDELSMLETIAEYQQDVQKAMRREYAPKTSGRQNILETEFTATYIINDIRRLYSVAERVHAAVNTTVSLHQSETANIQAELSIQQGRVLMVFTVVTILFLPLSFLTSLFALDVSSFQQAPPWALGVIFSVSSVFFFPTVIAAFTWKRSKRFLLELLGLPRPGISGETLVHNDGSSPDARQSESSAQLANKRSNFFLHLWHVLQPGEKVPDPEEGHLQELGRTNDPATSTTNGDLEPAPGKQVSD